MSNVSTVPAAVIPTPVLTKEQFKRVLPKNTKVLISDELLTSINSVMTDPQLRENYRENLLSYTGVLADGKYKISSYVEAVKYVSYKLMGSSNVQAYTRTFPDRYQRLVNEGADEKTISAYVAAYNKNQLVNKILEQTLIPTHIINADLYQKAINRLAYLMSNANSEKVQSDSATSLLTHLKMPETTKVELDVNVKQDKSIDALRASTMELVAQQKKMLEAGAMNAKQIAESNLIIDMGDAEIIDNDSDSE